MTDAQNKEIIALYERWAKTMFHLTARRLHNAELAKDLVHEVFLLACCKADELFARGDNPKAWLFRALENLTMQERKRGYFLNEISVDNLSEYLSMGEKDMGGSLGLIELLPKGLSEDDKNILIWRLENRFTYDEISKRCKVSPDACRQRYARAIQHCRELLKNNSQKLSQN